MEKEKIMRTDAVSRIVAKSKKEIIDTKSIDKFVILANRRDIRTGTVNKLVRLLEQGKHFETPLMTNVVGRKDRLIDGNHRVEAIKKYLEKYPDRKVEAWIFYYEDLNEEEERKIYTTWNLGTKQSTNDFIKQYWDTFPIVKHIKKDFPCKVSYTWNGGNIELKQLVFSILYRDCNFPPVDTTAKTIERLQEMPTGEYQLVREFMKEYIALFGQPDKKNLHYGKNFFCAMQRIWADNYKLIPRAELARAFNKLRGCERAIYYSTQGGVKQYMEDCRMDLLRILNRNRKTNLFVDGNVYGNNQRQVTGQWKRGDNPVIHVDGVSGGDSL